MNAEPLRYVALGDSYTIGTSVPERERWPNQLVERLRTMRPERNRLELVANLAVNGYTARDVIERELPAFGTARADFASLLVGVNDVIQGVSLDTYRARIEAILTALVGTVGTHRVLAVTTPDYTVTSAGADYGKPATVSAQIRRFNDAFTAAARAHEVAVVDVYDLSRRAADDRILVARDGLHPSGPQYALWVERIVPVVFDLLRVPASGVPAD